MKQLIILLLITAYLNAKYTSGSVSAPQPRLDKLIKKVDINFMMNNFRLDWSDMSTCGGKTIIPGPRIEFPEPVGLIDYTQIPYKIHSLGISFKEGGVGKYYRFSMSRKSANKTTNHSAWIHIVFLPFLSLAMGDNQALCFNKADVSIPYIAELDITYDGTLAGNAFPEIESMYSIPTIFSSVVDCLASSTSDTASSGSFYGKSADFIRAGMYYSVGCWDMFPMGGNTKNSSPIISAGVMSTYGLSVLHRTSSLLKTSSIPGLDGGLFPNSDCNFKYSPILPKTQYFLNLAYPLGWKAIPWGMADGAWSQAKQYPGTLDVIVFWLWQRKSFYLGASACSKIK